MTDTPRLYLYEEITLLALRDKKGTLSTCFASMGVAGALMAELLLEGRVAIDGTRKKLIEVRSRDLFGDPVLDEALRQIAASSRRASLNAWIPRLANAKNLHHRVAQQLCRRGILRADEDTVLLIFRRKIYPELNPLPERELIERMRNAIVSDSSQVDPRTMILLSLARAADLLATSVGRDVVKAGKARIKAIVQGEATGKATREVIEATQAAMIAATVVPTIVAGSHH